jgi:hypothetical protein
MRLTIWIISKMMSAIDTSLDEVAMKVRGDNTWGPKIAEIRGMQKATGRRTREILIEMLIAESEIKFSS